jgi:hypothetical protein
VGKGKDAIKKGANMRPNLLAGQSNVKNTQDELILFNFKFMDPSQGQTFIEWEKDGLLAQAFDVFKSYSSQKMTSAKGSRFKSYPNFPPKEKTDYRHPKHVPEDALWSSMHLQGKPCVIGHIYRNVFYVVFLDRHHCFYKSPLRNT